MTTECNREVLDMLLGAPARSERPRRWGTVGPLELSWACGCRARQDEGFDRYELHSCGLHQGQFDQAM